jgi:hypothetical protein
MHEVRFPAAPALISVCPLRVAVSALDERSIRRRLVGSDALDEGIYGRDHDLGAAFRIIS